MVANPFFPKVICSLIFFSSLAACTSSYQSSGPVGIGKPITENQIRLWNIDIGPNGEGLPSGSGTAIVGESLFQQQCASCHGDKGQGAIANRLVGGGGLNTKSPVKTIGSYWPYSTTIFDYTRRSMPHNAPQSLTNDQVYAATAYILYLNQIISKEAVMNAKTLPLVKMPNRDGFIRIEH
jgi:S-disulfanyl-L-cysteine oxidoreductase SoxD